MVCGFLLYGFLPLKQEFPHTHTPTKRNGIVSADTDDRMLHPKIFKQIQKLRNHTFTLDARTNSKGDNALCARYCSIEDSFLDKDLKGEFVWLNPPFKRAKEFLEAYFAQKRAYPRLSRRMYFTPLLALVCQHP